MDILKCLLLVFSVTKFGESANILYVIPFTGKSHYIYLRPLGLELARRGHNVTVITGNRETNPPPNYHQAMVDEKEIWDVIGGPRLNVFEQAKLSMEEFHKKVLWRGGIGLTEVTLNSTEVKALLVQNIKFDLVISEQFFQEALNVLAHKYNTPLVLITTFGNCMKHNIVIRNPLQLATVPFELVRLKDPTSFWGRLKNLYYSAYEYTYWRYIYLEQQEELVRKYLPGLPAPVPSLYELQKNADLFFVNGHFSFDGPIAYLPNVIEIGGMHLSDSDAQLPEDFRIILDSARNGVVYMSFGSNVRSTEMSDVKRNAFLNVFRQINQTVLWKWEDDNMENKPDNVIITKWMPQKEILAHPNVKVFISHGGLIGTQEAVFYGVPLIGVPIYSDQYNNLLQAQNQGFGKILIQEEINEENFGKILKEVLNDDSYMRNAKLVSARFKDRPASALDTAMYWIEYVLRNNGAKHMRNPALELNWVAYTMVDVYAFILIVFLAAVYVCLKMLSFMASLKNTSKGKKEKKKKTT